MSPDTTVAQRVPLPQSQGNVEPAWYVVWVKAPDEAKPRPGVSYDDVATTRLPPPSAVREILGPRRPSGWVLQKLDGGRGSGRGIVHAVPPVWLPFSEEPDEEGSESRLHTLEHRIDRARADRDNGVVHVVRGGRRSYGDRCPRTSGPLDPPS
ncbi:hypothetical protein ACFY1B_45445 [Streptomyces mirabilis]|uniref:hypothetical protein n=1 Tax=Streptomyces mirabilis TaxID=68239 RepID=UPI0036B016E8